MSKSKNPHQLSLHLPLEAASAREDLIVTQANVKAVTFLDSWPAWPGEIAILAGPVGAGKTHLANIWAAKAGAEFVTPGFSSEEPVPESGNYVVEDIRQGRFSETWLFHLINTVKQGKGSLLLTSRRWPGDWGIALPDLQSRMKLAHLMELNEPDDEMLTGVLAKLFSDRQLIVEPSVVDFLVLRMERSLASAQTLVDEIDRLSLSQMKGVTKPLAAQAMKRLDLPH